MAHPELSHVGSPGDIVADQLKIQADLAKASTAMPIGTDEEIEKAVDVHITGDLD
jgi:hypothetical protein